MAIIISKNHAKAVKVEKSEFEKEDHLQKYIYENPESIPLYEIKEDIRLLILAREFPTNSGPIDAIGIDNDGEIYIVETKLYKNPDKRLVIAQALDYGAALWKHSGRFENLLAILNQHSQKTFGMMATEKIQEFFSFSDDEVTRVIDNAKANLNDGVFHFVILMDELGDRLKDLIIYVNQNSQFDIYAVELEYYKYEAQEIIIPRIFGAEVKKDVGVASRNAGQRRHWDEDALINEAQAKYSSEEFHAFKEIYEFSKKASDEVRFGTGVSHGSFNPIFREYCPRSLYTLSTNGKLSFNVDWIRDKKFCQRYIDLLVETGFTIEKSISADGFIKRPSVTADEWVPRAKKFIEIIIEITSVK